MFLAADNAIIVVAADSIHRVYAFVETDICAVAYARVGLVHGLHVLGVLKTFDAFAQG